MKKTSIRHLAVQVVLDANRPLHILEVTRRVKAKIELLSRTPANTISNALQLDPRVVRVGPGIYKSKSRARE